ncbi:phage head closure protein [Pararhizobium mangrovi]|nr:phage head closure protein [Pararhizobium mangrovi]
MRAGKLDRTISLERQTETVADSGAISKTWTKIATVRAEIVTASMHERLTGYGEAENGNVVFRIRYLAGLTTADRVTYDGKHFDLDEIVEIGRRRGLELRGTSTS